MVEGVVAKAFWVSFEFESILTRLSRTVSKQISLMFPCGFCQNFLSKAVPSVSALKPLYHRVVLEVVHVDGLLLYVQR